MWYIKYKYNLPSKFLHDLLLLLEGHRRWVHHSTALWPEEYGGCDVVGALAVPGDEVYLWVQDDRRVYHDPWKVDPSDPRFWTAEQTVVVAEAGKAVACEVVDVEVDTVVAYEVID